MKYTLQQPGRSIYKLEQSILKIFKFSIACDYRTIEQGWTTYSFVFLFSEKKKVQSAAIKQGRSANRKHTYFFFGLSGSYNISSQIKVSHLPCCVTIRIFLAMTASCVRQLICSAHDRISEKVNLKVCCFESSKQKL